MVEINNLTSIAVDEVFLKKITEKVLKGEKKEGELSVALVGNERIKELNNNYRKKNRVTDVLSFSEKEVLAPDFPSLEAKFSRLGEVVICLSEVKKNAKKFTPLEIRKAKKNGNEGKFLTGFKSTFEKELAHILIHGVLHLLGYDHEKNEKGAQKMQKKEKYYLDKFKLY